MHRFTESEKAFFVKYVPGHSYKEIQQEFIKQFGWEITLSQIKGCIVRYKLNTGRNGQFKKGSVPFNKGKKMSPEQYEKCKGTMFKKGQVSKNKRPVGSERINVDGYVEIKTEEPNKWELKHRYVWEQVNGKVPNGYILIFRDNDKSNIDIDNLILISRAEHVIINHQGLATTMNETKELAVNYAKLSRAICGKKRKRKE